MGVGGETKLSKFIAEDSIKKQLNQSKERRGQRELGISAADRHTRFSLQKKKMYPAGIFGGKHKENVERHRAEQARSKGGWEGCSQPAGAARAAQARGKADP